MRILYGFEMRGAADLDRDLDRVLSLLCIYLEDTISHNVSDSRTLSTTVASRCQTLRKLLAGETTDSPAHQLAVWRMRSSLTL